MRPYIQHTSNPKEGPCRSLDNCRHWEVINVPSNICALRASSSRLDFAMAVRILTKALSTHLKIKRGSKTPDLPPAPQTADSPQPPPEPPDEQ
jgi:hypothetical protein